MITQKLKNKNHLKIEVLAFLLFLFSTVTQFTSGNVFLDENRNEELPPVSDVTAEQSESGENVTVMWTAPEPDDKDLLSYSVYRLTEGQTEEDWTLLKENVTETEYIDNEWLELESDDYQYAVIVVYTEGVSESTLSNILNKEAHIDFQFNITTSAGTPPTGATIFLTNQNDNPLYIYEEVSGTDGFNFQDVRTGYYNLKITLSGFREYKVNGLLIAIAGKTYEYKLIELAYSVGSVKAQEDDGNSIITWTEITTIDEFRHDSGINDGQIGFANGGTRSGVMGSVHVGVSTTLTKMSWFSTEEVAQEKYDLFILGLNANGTPNRNQVLYTVQNISNTPLQWCEYVFPTPISISNGFFIGVSPSNGGFLSLGTDAPNSLWEFKTNTSFYSSDYTRYDFTPFEQSSIFKNAMIRAEGSTAGKSVIFGDKAHTGFNVYRAEVGLPEAYWDLVAENINGYKYSDEEWSGLSWGEYFYGVRAVYPDNILSPVKLSNILQNKVQVEYRINIDINSGDPATGAKVELTKIGTPSYYYSAISEEDGVLMKNIERGFYSIKITHPGYGSYSADYLDARFEGGSHTANLIELIAPPINPVAEIDGDNAKISWNVPVPYNDWIKWCSSDNVIGTIGYSADAGNTMTAAIRFLPADLKEMGVVSGHKITKLALGLGTELSKITSLQIMIWVGGNSITNEGQLAYSQVIPSSTFSTFKEKQMNEVVLNTPFVIDVSKELRVGYRLVNTGGYPLGLDNGPLVEGKGNLFMCPGVLGGGWIQVTDALPAQIRNFAIKAFVSGGSSTISLAFNNEENDEKVNDLTSRSIRGYNVYRLAAGAPVDDWDLVADSITELTFSDTEWSTIPNGIYQWAIEAIFGTGESVAVFTNELEKYVGIDSKTLSSVGLYPNPFENEINITNYSDVKSVQIVNVTGQKVKEVIIDGKTISTKELTSGIYFITIESITGDKVVYKMIKK